MGMVLGSVGVLVGAVIAFFIVGSLASVTITVVGRASYAGMDQTPASKSAPVVSFLVLLGLYLAWAYLCWAVADWLALAGVANRWVLLLSAVGLAGAPYHWAQRSARDRGEEKAFSDGGFGSSFAYAGGLQSKIVVVAMLSGILFDWWSGLPG